MALTDPNGLIRSKSSKGHGLPDKIKHNSGSTAIGLMILVVEECELHSPGYLTTASETYRIRRMTGLPMKTVWDWDCYVWGRVLDFKDAILGLVSASGISFVTQGEGKGNVFTYS